MGTIIYKPKTQDQIYTAMKNYLIANNSSLNNFNIGSRLSVMLEAISLVSGESQNDFYQGLLKAIPIAIYEGFDFPRNPGLQSSGTLQFSSNSPVSQDTPIPTGTQINLNGVLFQTTALGTILNGQMSSANVAAQCVQIGIAGNINLNAINTLSGQGSFINQPTGVDSCINNLAFTNGTDEESSADRIQRFRTYILSLVRSNIGGITAAVLGVSGIKSVSIVEYYPDDGWITIYADDGTGNLSSALQAQILQLIVGDENNLTDYPGYVACGIHVQVLPPIISQINVTATLYVNNSSSYANTQFVIIVENAIQQYTNSLKMGQNWIKSEIITLVMNSNSDINDFQITVPSGNVTIASGILAKISTITLSVTRE